MTDDPLRTRGVVLQEHSLDSQGRGIAIWLGIRVH